MTTQVNLHAHTDGSLIDGLSGPGQHARRAAEVGNDAAAVTDHNEVNQHFNFQKACAAVGIHPVLGMEADWIYSIEGSKERYPRYPSDHSHVCLLAETDEGLSNVWKLSTLAYQKPYHRNKPLLTPELMREYSAGIFASDGCMITEFAGAVQLGDEDLARQHFSHLLSIYRDHFYSELHTWQFIEPVSDEEHPNGPRCLVNAEYRKVKCQSCLNTLMTQINQAKVAFATEMGVPMVVVNDCHHAHPAQWHDKEMVWRYSTGSKKKKTDDSGDQVEAEHLVQKADHLMGGDELYGWMARHGVSADVVTEAIANSHRIAHACHAQIRPTLGLPRLNATDVDDLKVLMSQVQAGFQDKVVAAGLPSDVYFARVEEELSLIARKGFCGYFLMVQDEVEAATSGNWAPYVKPRAPLDPQLVGPGRGSAGGSLVAWLTGITTLDPIHYDLLFERFLAPGRKGYPDIDVDFPQSQRGGEKEYLSTRYGHGNVCSIGTMSRSKPKGLLKDLCRALDIPIAEAMTMSKIIEQVSAIDQPDETESDGEAEASWAEIVAAKGGELGPWASKYPELFEKLNRMLVVGGPNADEGIIRTSSVHASGVVVSNEPLLGTIPLRSRVKDEVKVTVTQFDMYEVEELGAVKLDILGIRHLDTLMQARNMIYERHGVWLDFRTDKLPRELRGAVGYTRPITESDRVIEFGYDEYADPAIWPQMAEGRTAGIFQVETASLTRLCTQLKPQNEQDVAALITIVRPGVADARLDQVYLRRRAGVEEVAYDHPMMESITSSTYGVLIYQEQLLRTAKELARFTADEASDLQKALSKKWMDKIVAFREKFIEGCRHNDPFMDPFCLNIERDYDEDRADLVAEKIWASIEASGRYAFNKSHAVGYAIISTWEVWTKHYYPEEYLVALMATDPANVNLYLRDARRRGIRVLPPSINESARRFTIGEGFVRYGLDTIRGVGDAAVNQILAARPFTSMADLLARCKLGKIQMEALINIGAMDEFRNWQCPGGVAGATLEDIALAREQAMTEYHDHQIWMDVAEGVRAKKEAVPGAVAEHIAAWRDKHSTQPQFKEAYERTFAVPNYRSEAVLVALEQQLVGNYVTLDPMERYRSIIEKESISHPDQIATFETKSEFVIGGMLTQIKPIKVKKEGPNKGREMGFLTVTWNEEDFEITAFMDAWDANKLLMLEGMPVLCHVVRDARGCNLKHLQRLDGMVGS